VVTIGFDKCPDEVYKRFEGRHIISIRDFDRQDIECIISNALSMAELLKKDHRQARHLLEGQRMGVIFYEPSTRTVLSFETAMELLGGSVSGIKDPKVSSAVKGETLADTIRVMAGYFYDFFVIRHYDEGSVRRASEHSRYPANNMNEGKTIPAINGGDGSNQHPTQTVCTDMPTVVKHFGTLDGLVYLFNNDLKNGRTVHSFVEGLMLCKPKKLYFCSPTQLRTPENILRECAAHGIAFEQIPRYEDALPEVDVFYDTRPQLEREQLPDDLKGKIRAVYTVRADEIRSKAKKEMIILHPLPRDSKFNSPEYAVDSLPQARYFEQSHMGVAGRAGLLCLLKGVRL
jgi:aspartate carbamoyltransferase catalytic subunit